ncbi:hypothetical protein CHU92_13395 [Flavobacterium cyanobacteriorum]|uniref:Outer membrane protein beta-barrel domain-containing protein n=1 Tax=Flavobacterium cyanobacteriorum TaxID=2022802 RepID=A0A255YV98_9FLAO|nr:hypothetical protein [Flavobacterium cyanobacteriorum]OYQ33132.1 hypothetical protein CHU92_13395 [Flavobacterium cyanobacteriorum]
MKNFVLIIIAVLLYSPVEAQEKYAFFNAQLGIESYQLNTPHNLPGFNPANLFSIGASSSYQLGNKLLGLEFSYANGDTYAEATNRQVIAFSNTIFGGYLLHNGKRLKVIPSVGLAWQQIQTIYSSTNDSYNLQNAQLQLNHAIRLILKQQNNMFIGIKAGYKFGFCRSDWKDKITRQEADFNGGYNSFHLQLLVGGILDLKKR